VYADIDKRSIYRVAQKSKLLTQYNSLLFLSHPVGVDVDHLERVRRLASDNKLLNKLDRHCFNCYFSIARFHQTCERIFKRGSVQNIANNAHEELKTLIGL